MTTTTPLLIIQLWDSGITQPDLLFNNAFRKVDALLAGLILSRTTDAEPGSPSEGDAYIITGSATGTDWSTFSEHDIAVFSGAVWTAYTPSGRIQMMVNDESNAFIFWDGSAWSAVPQSTTLTTKGDVFGYDTTNKRIPVGANDDVLTADSTQALGLKWATPSVSGGGLTVEFKIASFTAASGKKYLVDSTGGAVVVTLPAGNDLDNIIIADVGHDAVANNITINPDGAETIDNNSDFIIDQKDGVVDIGYNNGDTNWEVSAGGLIESRTLEIIINDDDVWVFDFNKELSIGALIVGANVTGTEGIFSIRARSTGAFVTSIASAGIDTTTGVLTGTTGSDAVVTISTHTDNKLYIENRTGGSRSFSITLNYV